MHRLALFICCSAAALLSAAELQILSSTGKAVQQGGETVLTALPKQRGVKAVFKQDLAAQPDHWLVFEYRNVGPVHTVFNPNSSRLRIGSRTAVCSFGYSAGWRRCALPLGNAGDRGKRVTRLELSANLSRRQALRPGIGLAVRNLHVEKNPGYDPAEEIPVAMSAIPHLDWRRAKPGESFTLTLSGNGKKRTFELGTRNWFHPAGPLDPGVWSWQVKVNGKSLTANRFRVTPDAHRWIAPEPDPARLAALPHPRLKALAQYWNPDVENILLQGRRQFHYRTTENPPAWDPADKRYASWSDWRRIELDGKMKKAGYALQDLGMAAMFSRDPRYAAKAREILLAITRTWNPEDGNHPRNSDLASAQIVIGMSFAYDAIADRLDPAEREEIRKALRIRVDQFWDRINPIGSRDGNHTWDNVSAAAFGTVALGEEWERFACAVSLYAYRFLPGRGFDGESEEGLAYWSYGFGLGMRFLDLAEKTCGVNLYRQPWVYHTARFPLYCQPPGGHCVSFADNGRLNHTPVQLANGMIAKLAGHTGDPVARWFAGRPETGPVEPPVTLDQGKLFRHIGEAVFNTFLPDAAQNVQLGFHSGRYFGNHQHADQNSFVINAYGDKLAVDGGFYDTTDSPHFSFYSITSLAHNTVLVDGQGQLAHSLRADGRITGFAELPDFGYVAGDGSSPHLYSGLLAKFLRQIVFVKPDYIVVYDQLAADRDRMFDFLLHAHIAHPIPVKGNTFEIRRPKAELAGTVLLPAKAELVSGTAEFPAPHCWNSPDLLPSPQPEQVLSIRPATRGRSTEFLVPMQISRPGTERVRWKKIETPDAVGAMTGDAIIVFSRKPGTAVRIGGLEFDGSAAAIRLQNGNAVSGMCAAGKLLRWNGKDVPVVTKLPVKTEKITLNVNGKDVPAQHFIRTLPNDRMIEFLSAVLPDCGRRPVRITTECSTALRSCRIVNRENAVSGIILPGKHSTVVCCPAGKTIFSMSSHGPIGKVTLGFSTPPIQKTVMEPANWKPEKRTILVEAEEMRSESGFPATEKRKGASGGRITTKWYAGAAGEWNIRIPEDGRYILRFRMATGNDENLRRLQIGSRDPLFLSFGRTGGFGYTPADWRFFRLPQAVEFAKGTHQISFSAMSGKGNLDCIVMERQDK